jgi:hypothetical protein
MADHFAGLRSVFGFDSLLFKSVNTGSIMPKLNHVIFRADDSEIERLQRLAKIYGNKSATVRRALDLLEEQVTEQSKALAA